jgi:hypothetical protein
VCAALVGTMAIVTLRDRTSKRSAMDPVADVAPTTSAIEAPPREAPPRIEASSPSTPVRPREPERRNAERPPPPPEAVASAGRPSKTERYLAGRETELKTLEAELADAEREGKADDVLEKKLRIEQLRAHLEGVRKAAAEQTKRE